MHGHTAGRRLRKNLLELLKDDFQARTMRGELERMLGRHLMNECRVYSLFPSGLETFVEFEAMRMKCSEAQE
jgi:hypothetical protein